MENEKTTYAVDIITYYFNCEIKKKMSKLKEGDIKMEIERKTDRQYVEKN